MTVSGSSIPAPWLSRRLLRQADGVTIPAYWVKSGGNTEDGRLIFGGTGGLTIVNPAPGPTL